MPTKPQQRKIYKPLPLLLKALREEAALSQRALALKLKKSINYAHFCETGSRRIDPGDLVEWAEACGMDPVIAWRRYLKLIGRQ